MPELISKIQFKTCEKGEFFDERPRSLEETIELIKDFPWDQQRGSDIQLSGPGIVIQNSHGEYLKVALYFNGKYSCYFLDKDNHLYEYHTRELLKAYKLVEGFFSDVLELSAFDKHFFNFGNRSHLETQDFVYTRHFSTGNNYLKLSKGHNDFYCGNDKAEIKPYNKQDIKEVVVYEERSSRSRYTVRSFEIRFKNGEILDISPSIVSQSIFVSKFKEDIVRVEYIYQ